MATLSPPPPRPRTGMHPRGAASAAGTGQGNQTTGTAQSSVAAIGDTNSEVWQAWFQNLYTYVKGLGGSSGGGTSFAGGTTAGRPTSPANYTPYFDTTLGYPVIWNGTNWVNFSGIIS